MVKRLVVLVLLLSFHLKGYSQNVSINYDIDTTVYQVAEPLNLWLNFLATQDDSIGSQYWNQAEVKRYGHDSYFLIENELQFGVPNYLKLLTYAQVKVLSIRKVQEYYKITSLMEFKPKDGKSNIQYIFQVYAGDDNGTLKLFNPLAINTKLYLNTTTVGVVRFHYAKSRAFNHELATRQSSALLGLSTRFEVPLDTIDYYFAETQEELQRMKGFDFLIGNNGTEIPSGKADTKNRIVYASGLGEYYPHEFLHILLNPHYPNTHLWIAEGVATYFGDSRGKNLDWHLQKVHKYLLAHPEIDLTNMLELRSLDEYTDFRYALGGWIIEQADKKGGYEMIKTLMRAGRTDEDFYKALEEHLDLKQSELNQKIRKALADQYRTE